MKLIKKFASFSAAVLLSLTSLTALIVPHAFAATATWTGGGSDTNMTTAANWGGVAPVAGDDLVFPANITNRIVNNDFAGGTSFNTITFSGATSANSNYTISGNALTLVAGITASMSGTFAAYQSIGAPLTLGGNQSFTVSNASSLSITGTLNLSTFNLTAATGTQYMSLSGAISGSGTITKTGTGNLALDGNNSTYTGVITVTSGKLYASSANALATSGGTVVQDVADISFSSCTTSTFNGNITLTGTSSVPSGTNQAPKLTVSNFGGCGGGGGYNENYGSGNSTTSVTFTGNIILSNDVTFATGSKDATLTGALSGLHKINMLDGYGGKLIVNGSANTTQTANGTYTSAPIVKTLSDTLATTSVGIQGSAVITLDGSRGDVNVAGPLATLKGTGTANTLIVQNGATVAPGHSPGTLTVTTTLTFIADASYEAEIKNATEFDQIKAATVTLGAGTAILNTKLVDGFVIKAADTFKIIDNTGNAAVSGTFKDMAEGATFKVGNGVFKITYKGGDGNDVVLTVVTVPTTPNTGFTLLRANPYLSLLATVMVTGALAVGFRKFATVRINK